MPIYSASSTQWPLLQSKSEQKFASGLFNVSAEFIRPVGNTNLPTEIETSIGAVEVWPEPTVSSGTDGFERINATGYGIFQSNVIEESFSLIATKIPYYFYSQDYIIKTANEIDSVFYECPQEKQISIDGISETCVLKTSYINPPSSFPVPSRGPVLRNKDYVQINRAGVTNQLAASLYPDNREPKMISKKWSLLGIRNFKYHKVTELEITYVGIAGVHMGVFVQKYNGQITDITYDDRCSAIDLNPFRSYIRSDATYEEGLLIQ